MANSAFEKAVFNDGWDIHSTIKLWGDNYDVCVTAQAYYEHDLVTNEQNSAYDGYLLAQTEKSATVERLLREFIDDTDKKAKIRFHPRTLLFQRDGSYALLLDDAGDPDDGIAVCLSPTEEIMSQDAYL